MPPLLPPPDPAAEVKEGWSAEARALAWSLLRNKRLTSVKDGICIEFLDASGVYIGLFAPPTRTTAIIGPKGWLAVFSAAPDGWASPSTPEALTTLDWADRVERGTVSKAFLLGRVRKSTPADLSGPPEDSRIGVIRQAYSIVGDTGTTARVEAAGKDRKLLVVHYAGENSQSLIEARFLIDTARHVIVNAEDINAQKKSTRTTYSDFVEVAGVWYPGRMENFDDSGKRVGYVTQKLSALAPGEFDRQWEKQMAVRRQAQLFSDPLPGFARARAAVAAGRATVDDRIALAMHYGAIQQWPRLWEHFDAAERLSQKPGMRWIRYSLLPASRRGEEAKKQFAAEAESLVRQVANQDDAVAEADYLTSIASRALEANEFLRVAETVRPLYDRLAKDSASRNEWCKLRLNALQQTGQSRTAQQLERQIAQDSPDDVNFQLQYVRNLLFTPGRDKAAFAWLDHLLAAANRDHDQLPEGLLDTFASILGQEGRYDELASVSEKCIKAKPDSARAHGTYLMALACSGRVKQADELAATWIAEGRRTDNLPPDVAARWAGAAGYALGNFTGSKRIEARWLPVLADAAMWASQRKFEKYPVQIATDANFHTTDACRRLEKQALDMLLNDVGNRNTGQLEQFLMWFNADITCIPPDQWLTVAESLRHRWEHESDPAEKFRIGNLVAAVLRDHCSNEQQLDFLRARVKSAAEWKLIHGQELLGVLLRQPWTHSIEDEALAVVAQICDVGEHPTTIGQEPQTLQDTIDALVNARVEAAMKTVAHPEQRPRTEFRAKRQESLRSACAGLAERLRKEDPRRKGFLAEWLRAERRILEVRGGQNLDKVADECWQLLAANPLVKKADAKPQNVEQSIRENLSFRALAMLVDLAVRPRVKPVAADRLLAWLEAAEKADRDEPRRKILQYHLLVALDRPQALRGKLIAWRTTNDDSRWPVALGYLEAEMGRFTEAIRLFEGLRGDDTLAAADLRALAGWYLLAGRKAEHQRAKIDSFKTMEENELEQWIETQLEPWNGNAKQPPGELSANVPIAFAALFEKASDPANRLETLEQAYSATHDSRLMAGLADAVIGHSSEQIYGMLDKMSGVLEKIPDEAAVDSITERIAEVRRRVTTDVDRRALDLLETLVERRAAELQESTRETPPPRAGRHETGMGASQGVRRGPAHGRSAQVAGEN